MRTASVAILALLFCLAQGCKPSHTPEQTSSGPAPSHAVAAAAASQNTQVAEPAPWLLTYAGKAPNELKADKRFPAFLHTHVSSKPVDYWVGGASVPSNDVREFLSGEGEDVQAIEHRYVIATGCPAHDCTENGMLWSDTVTGATVYAASLDSHAAPAHGYAARLLLFPNFALRAGSFPPALLTAIGNWTQQSGDPDNDTVIANVTAVEPDGTQTKLTPADVHAWQPGMPTRGK